MIHGEYATFLVTDLLINHANFQYSFYVSWSLQKQPVVNKQKC